MKRIGGREGKIEHGYELNLNEVIWLNYLMKDDGDEIISFLNSLLENGST